MDLLFLGSLDWRPNIDAVRLLLDEVFPTVRRALPEARLFIVGRNPPPWLAQAARQAPGVELAANVADVRGYLHSCGVMLVPLRIGTFLTSEVVLGQANLGKALALGMIVVVAATMTVYALLQRRTSRWLR